MEYFLQALNIIGIVFLIHKVSMFMLFALFCNFFICSVLKIINRKIKRYPLKS